MSRIPISFEERKKIETMLRQSFSNHEISIALNRNYSVISREINRFENREKYNAYEAEQQFIQGKKRKEKVVRHVFTNEEMVLIQKLLNEKQSHREISRQIKKPYSVISRHIAGNGGLSNYKIKSSKQPDFIEKLNVTYTEIQGQKPDNTEIVDIKAEIYNLKMQIEILTDTIRDLKAKNDQ